MLERPPEIAQEKLQQTKVIISYQVPFRRRLLTFPVPKEPLLVMTAVSLMAILIHTASYTNTVCYDRSSAEIPPPPLPHPLPIKTNSFPPPQGVWQAIF